MLDLTHRQVLKTRRLTLRCCLHDLLNERSGIGEHDHYLEAR
jgi:hypothetical protein